MVLDSIEIKGFKSFPDKTRLSFKSGITAVVGPNGSGKSNVSDAVRWVLGEQSTKSLRSGKMEDVIFGGTAERRPLGSAEVTLVINNTDRTLPFDNDFVHVTRRYYRSGESEYRLNGAAVRLKDIYELFMDTGLGRDGYSIIGQGRIDDIVSSKSSQRREIFEEAAGITKFRYRKSEAEKKLSAAEDNLLRLHDIFSELKERIGPLKEQSEKAAEFLALSESKKRLEIGLWLHTLDESQRSVSGQEEKINLARAELEQLERDLSKTERDIEEHTLISQQRAVQIDEVRREISQLEEMAAAAGSDAAVKKNTIFHNNATIERLRENIESLSGDKSDLERRIAAASEQAEKYGEAVKEKQLILDGLTAELEELINRTSGYSDKIDDLNKHMGLLATELSQHRVSLAVATSAAEEAKQRMTMLDGSAADYEERAKGLEKESKELSADLDACDEKITECENSLKGYSMMLGIKQKQRDERQREIDALSSQISEKERRAKILADLENNMEGFYNSVKLVMSHSHNLPGILGPVSRLISVPQEYGLAIETALGGAMQNIVVENENSAKQAIAFLKERRGGRATFMPLTSVKGTVMAPPAERGMQGYIGTANTLISADAKYKNIVDYLLGRTVVADNLDNASAIAKKAGYKYKIVTLDGQQINSGGTYTGGSMSKTSGLLVRNKNIELLKTEAADLKEKLNAAEERFNTAKQEVSASQAEIVAAESVLKTAKEDKIRVLGEIKRVSEQLDMINSAKTSAEAERQKLSQRIEEQKSEISAAEEKISAAESSMSALNDELASLTSGRDEIKGEHDTLSMRISSARLEIVSAQKDEQSAKLEADELNNRLKGADDKNEQLLSEISAIEEQNSALNSEIEKTEADIDEMRKSIDEHKTEIERLSLQRDEAERHANELRAAERTRISEKERAAGEVIRLTEKKEALLREYDDIIAKLYDEYELTKTEAEQTGIKTDDPAASKRQLSEVKSKIKALGAVNVAAVEEYKEVKERYDFLDVQINDAEKSKTELNKLIDSLTKQMREIFTEQFGIINGHFKKIFAELFGGGSADLQLTEPDDVLQSGIDIIVQPPGKNISIIEQLSGGEKALIAISIYFAIMKVNPPPFCILDEVEAALDEVNVTRFAQYLRKMSGRTQFIVITHRRGTMEEADVLYGVTMQEKGISKLLQINASEIEKSLNMA